MSRHARRQHRCCFPHRTVRGRTRGVGVLARPWPGAPSARRPRDRGGVPARWHRHRQRLDRGPRRAPGLGDLQPRRQGDLAALHASSPSAPARRTASPSAGCSRRRIGPPHEGDSGHHIGKVAGLPRLDASRMSGEYPLLTIEFTDRAAAGRGATAGVHARSCRSTSTPPASRGRCCATRCATRSTAPVDVTVGRLDVLPGRDRGPQHVPDAGVRGSSPGRRTAVRAARRTGVRHRPAR